MLIASVLTVLGAEAINTLDIFFVTSNLHTAPQLYGLLSTAYGAGLIVGSMLGGLAIQRLGLARTFWLSLIAIGVLFFLYARQNSFLPACILLLLSGVPSATVNVAVMPLILHAAPKELIGRVMSVFRPANSVAQRLMQIRLILNANSSLASTRKKQLVVPENCVSEYEGGTRVVILDAVEFVLCP
jgi:MFS family permease